MLKRKVLKRVLPIMLSLAMTLQSVPMTALAAELPVASEETETVESGEAAENSESKPEGDVAADTGAESGEAAENSESKPEGDVAADTGVESGETAGNSESKPEGDQTADTGVESGETAEDSEGQPEGDKTPEGTVSETVTEVEADKSVEPNTEEGDTTPQETGVASIVVNDTDVDGGIGVEGAPGGITRKLDETGLAFFTEYVDADKSQVGNLQSAVKNWLDIEVDGEKVNDLKDRLTYKWVKKADTEGGADAELKDAMPVDAGTYELTISLDIADTNGLCSKVEPADGVKLTLTIEKAKIELWLDEAWAMPGTTVGDLIDRNKENYQVVYAGEDRQEQGEDGNNRPKYIVSKDILDITSEDKKLPVKVYESGASTEMQPTDKFDSRKDYVLKIDPALVKLTADAGANYELRLDDSYKIWMDDSLQYTWIEFKRKDDGEDLIKEYKEGTSYSIDTVVGAGENSIFTAPETDAEGNVTKAGGAPAVYVMDDKQEEKVILKDAVLTAAWYTRIQLSEGEEYTVDEDAGEFQDDEGYIYKPMKADPVDAGEYYIVWSYAGDEGAYEPSRSDTIRFTIDPAPVVITIDETSVTNAGFRDGMTAKDVAKAIAKITPAVYPIVKNEQTGALEAGTSPISAAAEPGFFGTSYGIENETDMTQYFVPEFVLQRMPVKMTEKGGKEVTVNENAVDWTPTAALNVVVDNEDEEFSESYFAEELPQDAKVDNLESVEFKFRVAFTGNKVVYDKNGNKQDFGVPVTDVTTNAANKNYLVDITKPWLEKSRVELKLDAIKTSDVTINTDKIVEAFITANQAMLYPQPAEGADAKSIHEGSLAKPATKIYDQSGLFANRDAYKKAVVNKKEDGSSTGIEGTNEKLTYTWNYISLDTYEKYLDTWDEVQREYKDFDEFYYNEWSEDPGWTSVEDGTLINPKSAGVYRLTVTFDDKDRVYRSAEAEVFFKVEKQEVIVVPTTKQYVGKDDVISDFAGTLNKLENRTDYIIYKLPHNDKDEFDNLTDDAKKAYEIPTEDALSLFETKNGYKYGTQIVSNWKVLRKEKDSATGQDKKDAWVEATGTFDDDFTYGIAAEWAGGFGGLDGEVDGENYTTLNVEAYRTTGEVKHHQSVGAVEFFDQKIYVEVDEEKIAALGHEYDGTAVDLAKVAEALTFYPDAAMTEGSKLPASIVNTTDEYDPAKINIYWEKYKENEDDDEDNGEWCIYANKNAVYGGTYRLMLRFEGGALTTSAEATQDDTPEAAQKKYAPLGGDGWFDGWDADVEFTVTPRAITITPELQSASILKAGDRADRLVTGNLQLDDKVLENDKKFFSYMELAEGGFDVTYDGKKADGTDRESSAYWYNIEKEGGYPAFGETAKYVIQVDGREIEDPFNSDYFLRANKTYTVKLWNNLVSPLRESYAVTYAPNTVEVTNRGNAEVKGFDNGNLKNRVEYTFSNGTYTVMPRAAVKFFDSNNGITVTDRYGESKTLKNTNILGFKIFAPKEFETDPDFAGRYNEKFVYKNAIWNAGGYFYRGTEDWRKNQNGYYIDVVFPLTKDNLNLSFNITWEEGYTETFTLADVVLEEDLTKAVAPKSIAFNGVMSKMAVGERQQLNLKITKAQLGDVIAVRYRIKDSEETKNDYISLDPETGVVTALQPGKVATTIEAYPVYKDAKGKFMPILGSNGKPAKTASTKITVTEVTASTIKKIVAQGDGTAKLYFTVPDNGYRREIYVVDVTKGTANEAMKKWKPAQFNDTIAKVSNGDYKAAGFVGAPIYSYAKNVDLYQKEIKGEYDKKLKAHIATIRGLEAEHEYVIYVRNVSAVRELHDGSVVKLSANGAVKGVKTTKPQVEELELGFTIKTDENDKKNTVTHPVNEDGSIEVDEYEVELSAKKAQLNVYGLFSDKAGGNAAAEERDQRRYSLVPTLKEEKDALKKYQLPKLEYAIFDASEVEPFKPGLTQSKYAAISKKGLISLKGVDLNGKKTVYIYVRDNMQHQDPEDYGIGSDGARITLTITSKAASFTGKSVKAIVGQKIRLADCLTYKDEKKKALPNYRSGRVTITTGMIEAAKASGYEIVDEGYNEPIGDGEVKQWHDWYITPVAPNKAKFVLEVSDFDANGNLMTANVTLTSKQVDSVKGLKVTYVDDQHITINFTHAANKNEADNGRVYQYAFEIKDARGNVVEKRILSNPTKIDNCDMANAKELKSVQSWIQYSNTRVSTDKLKDNAIKVSPNNSSGKRFNYYTGARAKTKTFAYTYTNEKLVRLSSYTISVTPLFENQKADKPTTTKTKTTNIPASYNNVDVQRPEPDRLGGNAVVVTTTLNKQQGKDLSDERDNVGRNTLNSGYWFTSGNTYTLKLVNNDNVEISRDRVTDTLTWKSSNTKVATIKANAGTYTATFKPVNQGETTITVTSKVTKKVIARWAVKVCAIQDGSGYGGDYEPTWDRGFYENILALYDPYYDGAVEVLSMNVPLTIAREDGQETWVSFTAPHFGVYTFDRSIASFYDSRDGRDIGGTRSDVYTDENNDQHTSYNIDLEEGQKVYFKTNNGTLQVWGSEFARLTKENKDKDTALEVKSGCVSFTAWEDNVYTFWLNGSKVVLGQDDEENDLTEAPMEAGDSLHVWVDHDGKMYVTCRDLSDEVVELGAAKGVTLDMEHQTRYVSYTAKAAGEYEFKCVVPEGVEYKISAANGDDLTHAQVKEELTSENEKDGTTECVSSYSLEEGQKVVIAFTADPEIKDAAKTLSASVTVTAPTRREVEKDTITIPKGTTEIVKYVIPAFTTEKARFKFEVTGEDGTEIEKCLDKNYDPIREGINAKSFILTAGKDADVKAGDKIYIEVTAGAGEADDKDAKDAELKVTQISVKLLEANKAEPETIANGGEYWYTFKALEDGFYEFGVSMDKRPDGDTTPVHTVTLSLGRELFGTSDKGSAPQILALKSGETLALKLKANNSVFKTNTESTKEAATSDANVSVKKLEVKPLALGKEKAEPVKMDANSKEVKYYSFTATADASYTMTWQPTDSTKDGAKVTFLNGDPTSNSGTEAKSVDKELGVGNVSYIKVEAKDDGFGNAVDGKLCVTADTINATVLTVGALGNYDLAKKDGVTEQVFKFTAPKSGWYAIVTTVGDDPDTGLPYAYPNLYWVNGDKENSNNEKYNEDEFAKGQTVYITVSLGSGLEKAAGTILIRSAAEEITGDQTDVTVANGVAKEYTFKITESGRYKFRADYDEEKASVTVEGNSLTNASGSYYYKNQEVTIRVTGLDDKADATVKLYKPEKITPKTLIVGENPIDVKAGETAYYEISTANDPKTFEFEVAEISGTTVPSMRYAIDDECSLGRQLYDGDSIVMAKNSNCFIKITSSNKKKDLNCKLNVAERRELKVGDNEVTLKAGEKANLTLRAPETGYYSFRVDQPGAELAFVETNSIRKAGDSFYTIREFDAKESWTYSLTNEGASEIKLTVKIAAVTPIPVKPGSTTAEEKVPADEEVYYELKAFKAGTNYLVKVADTSKGADLVLTLDNSPASEKKTADGVSFEFTGQSNKARILRIKNDGIKETAVTVALAEDEAQPLTAEAITLAKNETKLISFVAPADNRYLISKDNDKVKMTLVKEWDADNSKAPEDRNEPVNAYAEKVLGKADKLVYKLSYEAKVDDEKAAAFQTVNVKIVPVNPTEITATSTPIPVEEKGNKSLWYQLTADKDAIYTFSLKDAYENEESGRISFYSYMTAENGEDAGEKFVEKGDKLIVNINLMGLAAGAYTLNYKAVEAVQEVGTRTMDFEYRNEVQEFKFPVQNGGIYKVSAAAFRGDFEVVGTTSADNQVVSFGTENGRGSATTSFLSKGDIVTFKVTATSEGKSSVSLRIAEDNMAIALEPDKDYTGNSSTKKDIYYETRITETAMYAISASGEPKVCYYVNGDDETTVSGVKYVELTKDDRVVIKVAQADGEEKAYAIKLQKISAASLDGNDAADKALEATEGEKDYVFTKKNAYVKFTAKEAGNYYIAVDAIQSVSGYDNPTITPAATWTNPGMVTLAKDATVEFTLTNPAAPAKTKEASKEAMFRLTIRMAKADNEIKVDEPQKGTLGVNEEVSYQFKATEKAKYLIGFKGLDCTFEYVKDQITYAYNADTIATESLEADGILRLTVKGGHEKAGRYELSVTKLVPKKLTLGKTETVKLNQGDTVYYEFDSTVTADDGKAKYQVYWSGVDEVGCEGVNENGQEVILGKDDKLSFKVKNDTKANVGFKLTVKEVKYTSITAADTAVSGSLEGYENAYYEFTSAVEKETPYQVSLEPESTSVWIKQVQKVSFIGTGEDKKLDVENPTNVTGQNEVNLEKGEKLLITLANGSDKKGDYALTVENKTEPAPTVLELGEKQTGKLNTVKEKAAYEFTADAEDTYSVYFNGNSCTYVWTTVKTDADGKTTTETFNGQVSGSREFTCKADDKITFTVSGIGKYELTVKKVAYTKLTAGTQVSKTLNWGETVYYEFTSTDTPATGEETTKYLVYGTVGSCAIQARKLTVDKDGKTDNPRWGSTTWNGEKDLKKDNEILQFKVTNSNGGTTPFKLTVKKVDYTALTLGTTVEGQYTYANDGYPYYEFTSTDTPAEGETTTDYYVYGTGSFSYSLSRKVDDKITWEDQGSYEGGSLSLEKDQRVRFRVTSSPYSLTVAKQPEAAAITLNTPVKTGKLVSGQMLVYTMKHTADAPADYALDYESGVKGVSISATVNGSWIDEKIFGRFQMQKDAELKVTITAYDDVDDFTFTVKEFKPETLTLGTTVSKVLDAGETVYYQYPVGKTAAYVLSMTSTTDSMNYTCEVTGGENAAGSGSFVKVWNEIAEKAIMVCKVTNDAETKQSFKMTLWEKPAESEMTALEVKDNALTLKAGEVKYLKFVIPDAEKAKDTRYVLYVPKTDADNVEYSWSDVNPEGVVDNGELIALRDDNVSKDFTVCVANTSMSEQKCSINLQQREALTLGTASEKSLKRGETVYYQYKAGAFAEGKTSGTYVVSVVASESNVVTVNYRMNSVSGTISGIQELTLAENDVLLLEAKANNAGSYKLTLQKKPDEADMTALEAKDNKLTVNAGEVKYFKFTVPEEEKENGTRYALSIPRVIGVDYESRGVALSDKWDEEGKTVIEYYNDSVTNNFTICLVNGTMFAKECSIILNKVVVEKLTLGTPSTGTLKKGETVYYQYKADDFAENEYYRDYVLSVAATKPNDVTVSYSYSSSEYEYGLYAADSIRLTKDDILSLEVKARNATSYQLTLQKKPDAGTMDALKVQDNTLTLGAGEVKYLKFTPPEEDSTRYMLSMPDIPEVVCSGITIEQRYDDETHKYFWRNDSIGYYFEMCVANRTMSAVDYNINLQESTVEILSLGTAPEKSLAAGETAYYRYEVDDYEEWAAYMISIDGVNLNPGDVTLKYRTAHLSELPDVVKDNKGETVLWGYDALLIEVTANTNVSYELTLQKREGMEIGTLPTDGAVTLAAGEVKYFQFKVEYWQNHMVSIPTRSSALKAKIIREYNGHPEVDLDNGYEEIIEPNSDSYIIVRVRNVSEASEECEINVQGTEYSKWYSYSNEYKTITSGETQYYMSKDGYPVGDYKLGLTCEEGDVKVEYSTDSAENKAWTVLPEDGMITLNSYTNIFLKVTYTGAAQTRNYTLLPISRVIA